jgi:phosphatidylinositol alpha-1,6-mannosyltransferase
MSDSRPILLMTPSLDGHDGVAEVSRQAIAALKTVTGANSLEVWTLAGGRGDDRRLDGVEVRAADGGRTRMAAWALARSRAPLDGCLVVAMHLHLAPLAAMLAVRGAAVAVFLHGVEAWTPLRRRESVAFDRTSALLANSQYTATKFREANPRFRLTPISVCHLGAGPAHAVTTLPPLSDYALIVGRLVADERYKGHDALIAAWPEVCARVPAARLVIVGDGDDRARLERLAAVHGVSAQVVFTGRVPDAELAGWYAHASFLAMPSRGEGFGLVYVEAMRAGKPCIAAAGAAEEIVEHGVTGLVIDADTPDVVADTVVQLFTDAPLRDRMGVAASARVGAMFEERHFAARLLAALTPLMSGVAAGTPS